MKYLSIVLCSILTIAFSLAALFVSGYIIYKLFTIDDYWVFNDVVFIITGLLVTGFINVLGLGGAAYGFGYLTWKILGK